ncbi:MAG: hypothetical protein MI674_04080, partial [Cytophagales bacterium]|nr:hypothetical protein [Cytophagales bacterium]
ELSVLSASLEIKAAYEALNYHGLSDREQRSYDLAEKSRLDEIAKSMLAKNLSVDTISAVTGLSLEQVKALQ